MTSSPALEKVLAQLGSWGKPPDIPAQIALGLAVLFALLASTGRGRSLLGIGEEALPRRFFLWVGAFVTALLSLAWIAFYLRGGPRIVDATTYFLQGRALAEGDLSWHVPEPTGSFRGRFLDFRPGGTAGGGTLGGIFPPGYPLLLAVGFLLRAPMVVGPLLAGAIFMATYRLAKTLAEDAGEDALVVPIARAAALLSMLCAALRYHTADTMSHGATALGIVLALDAALRRRAWIAGLAIGAVVATRPVSAIPIALVVTWLLARSPDRGRALLRAFAAALPGIAFLLLSQKAVTGSWFGSSQRMYYALSDGPPDCFRWGFGSNVGCLNEHGEFVDARLPHGYGAVEALGTTLRRLRMHLMDVGNFEPLALLVLVPLLGPRAGSTRRSRAVLAALALVGLHVLAHAPFYFDGNYPGGGARFFADLLPVEHALIAVAIARLASHAYVRGVMATLALALFGFAVHASFDHEQLANRDGGRPMFEPDVLVRANVTTGLVFVDTDHGFSLGYDPNATPKKGVVVARLRNDDRDRLLYDKLDHPPTYLYKFELPPAPVSPPTPAPAPHPPAPAGSGPTTPSASASASAAGAPSSSAAPSASPLPPPPPPQATASVVPWTPPALGDAMRFEAEAEWPAVHQSGGFAAPAFTEACASGSRALVVTPLPAGGSARATITIPVAEAGRYSVVPRIVMGAHVPFTPPRPATSGTTAPTPIEGVIRYEALGKPTGPSPTTPPKGDGAWTWKDLGKGCTELVAHEFDLVPPAATFVVEAKVGSVAVDKITLRKVRTKP